MTTFLFRMPVPAPFAALRLDCGQDGALREVSFILTAIERTQDMQEDAHNPWLAWLRAYFQRKPARLAQTLGLAPMGTPFQQTLWHALCEIPYGQTMTYGQLAQRLNTSARAVGMACKANPLPLFIPCHRVIGQRGLGGYMGAAPTTLTIKRWLLAVEQAAVIVDPQGKSDIFYCLPSAS